MIPKYLQALYNAYFNPFQFNKVDNKIARIVAKKLNLKIEGSGFYLKTTSREYAEVGYYFKRAK